MTLVGDASSRLASLFLQVRQLLLRLVQSLLFGFDQFLFLATVLGVLCLIPQLRSGIRVVCSRPQPLLTRGNVEFALYQCDLLLLGLDLRVPVIRFLFFWAGGSLLRLSIG